MTSLTTIGPVKDLAGNPLILSATTTFTTGAGADLINPSLTQVIPAALTGHSVSFSSNFSTGP